MRKKRKEWIARGRQRQGKGKIMARRNEEKARR